MKKNYVWTTNRLLDTLNKYSNHKIISIEQCDDYIRIYIEYSSEKFKSKTRTFVYIYADGVDE